MGLRINLLQSSRSIRAVLIGVCLSGLCACSAGVSSVAAEVDLASGGARLTFQTEGRNTFTVGGASCEADKGGSCSVLLPAADLLPAWNRLEIATKRRTAQPLEVRFFIADEYFGRDCTVSSHGLTGDPDEMTFEVECTFPEGFTGSIDGHPMKDGKATVSAMSCLGELETLEVDVERPLLRGAIPLDVVGRRSRLRRGIPVAVPAPLVQVRLDGWASPWFEESIPLTLDAEPGATITVNGVPQSTKSGVVTLDVPISFGDNEITVLVSSEGHATARHALAIEGRYPATPLFLDQTYGEQLSTDRELLPLSGRTHPEAKLYLNGRPVEHRAGRFELDAPLEEGKNDVQLLAVIEASRVRGARPITRIDFEVHRAVAGPREFPTPQTARETEALTLVTVAGDPWAHVGAKVSFPMRVESISENLSMDGDCSARIEGLACAERVGGPVMLAWSVVQGWVCIGEQSPVVVEASVCPAAVEGDDVQITGVVQGALGGRTQGVTRDRPSIDATSASRLPATEILSPERRERFRPELLKERSRARKRRR